MGTDSSPDLTGWSVVGLSYCSVEGVVCDVDGGGAEPSDVAYWTVATSSIIGGLFNGGLVGLVLEG